MLPPPVNAGDDVRDRTPWAIQTGLLAFGSQ